MRISKPLNLPRQSTDGPMKHRWTVNEVATMCQLPWSVTPHLHGCHARLPDALSARVGHGFGAKVP